MEGLLKSLNDLTPVIAIGSLTIFMTLERWLPYFEHGAGRGRQRWHNLGMVYARLPDQRHARQRHAAARDLGRRESLRPDVPHGVWPPIAMVLGVFLIDLCLRAARHDALGSISGASTGSPCRRGPGCVERPSPPSIRARAAAQCDCSRRRARRRPVGQRHHLQHSRAALVRHEPQQHEIPAVVPALGQSVAGDTSCRFRRPRPGQSRARCRWRPRAARGSRRMSTGCCGLSAAASVIAPA